MIASRARERDEPFPLSRLQVMMPVRVSRDIPRLALFANKDIPPMEELSFHYSGGSGDGRGRGEESLSGLVGVPCHCGSSNCIKTLPYDGQLFGVI